MPQKKCNHVWRKVRKDQDKGMWWDGTVLQQCRKCTRIREYNIILRMILFVGGIGLIAWILSRYM